MASTGNDSSSARRLPVNRKERFYTGTVLPMIVANDDFAHLGLFLDLCGLSAAAELPPEQFLTEYSLAESKWTDPEQASFASVAKKDTPDIVVVGRDWLLVVEAKMFHRPSPRDLAAQLRAQGRVVDAMARGLRMSRDRVRHVVLLPAGFDPQGIELPIVRWEDVLSAYRDVASPHWTAVLAEALRRYPDLVSPIADFSANATTKMTGLAIVQAHRDGTLPYPWMGRDRGLTGVVVADDLSTGRWRTQRYQLRGDGPVNRNWFPVAEFVARLDG